MAILKKLLNYLENSKVDFECLTHHEAYTSQETAQAQHVSGKIFAKVVIFKTNGHFEMAVLPATHHVVTEKLKQITGDQECSLATESDLEELFPDCQVGAMPPFGNLYNLDVVVDEALAQSDYIVFGAGSHRDTVKMKYKDYAKLVQPKVGSFSVLDVTLKKAA